MPSSPNTHVLDTLPCLRILAFFLILLFKCTHPKLPYTAPTRSLRHPLTSIFLYVYFWTFYTRFSQSVFSEISTPYILQGIVIISHSFFNFCCSLVCVFCHISIPLQFLCFLTCVGLFHMFRYPLYPWGGGGGGGLDLVIILSPLPEPSFSDRIQNESKIIKAGRFFSHFSGPEFFLLKLLKFSSLCILLV